MNGSARRLNRIHLLHNTRYEKENLDPLAAVAEEHGYEVAYSTTRASDPASLEIAIYCGHAQEPDLSQTDPTAAPLSIVMLHDLGQSMWPSHQTVAANLWQSEPWDAFDVGILPGPSWSAAWRTSAASPHARPRVGVFELGYPKADRAFADPTGFDEEVRRLRESLEMGRRPTILLAPSWESDDRNRCEGFLRSLSDLDLNLLVKYQAGDDETARRMAQRFEGAGDHVRFVDVDVEIMTCLALSDIVVSDESNCLAEALLFDVPGLAVMDWDVPAVPSWGLPPRPVDPPEFVQHVMSDQLGPAVQATLADLPRHRAETRRMRDRTFTNLGSSAEAIISLVESLQDTSDVPSASPVA